MRKIIHPIATLVLTISVVSTLGAQTESAYKKRVLDNTELDFLMSYYEQDGDNAAVSGGNGTEQLTDLTPTFVLRMPLNDDDVLTVDVGISAYSSASSSNINPFDGGNEASPFQTSSGASGGDVWGKLKLDYSHSSDDRNTIWTASTSIASEYDYFSAGVGGSFTRLFNEKNTSLTFKANAFVDFWSIIYPMELRPFSDGGRGLSDRLFQQNTITGHSSYNPQFTNLPQKGRNTYALGSVFSQILGPRAKAALAFDVVYQQGLLSTPFQRVYFSDVPNSFIQQWHLADDIERLPDTRLKVALGGRLNYYVNETFVLRSFYRYYRDNWGINSHTLNVEVPIKVSPKFTIYPTYRFYFQSAAQYFAPYDAHLSSEQHYTSDYDLSRFSANQFGLGISYTDIFTKVHIRRWGLKAIDLKFNHYQRNSGLQANIVSLGIRWTRR